MLFEAYVIFLVVTIISKKKYMFGDLKYKQIQLLPPLLNDVIPKTSLNSIF